MKDCGLLINVSDIDDETPSSYSSDADVPHLGSGHLSNCSIIDGLSADILQVWMLDILALLTGIFACFQHGACGRLETVEPVCPIQEQIIGAVYPDRDRQIEATVWYNNQVCLRAYVFCSPASVYILLAISYACGCS